MGNIIEGILEEMNRLRTLRKQYEAIGSVGVFGCVAIDNVIRQGEAAIASGDAKDAILAYVELQKITG